MATEKPFPSDAKLKAIKARLKEGALSKSDLADLKTLVDKTELAAQKLRAAVVE